MTNQHVNRKPSETALMAALRRDLSFHTYQGAPFGPDNMAAYFLPAYFRFLLKIRSVRRNTMDKLETGLPGLQAYMIARTRFFDDLFLQALQDRTPQIVLLGAGYDTRPYRFAAHNHSTRIFELDSPPTQNRKRDCLQRGGIPIPESVNLVPIDFNAQPLAETLAEAGCKHGQKTLFLWEGVSYYLQAEAVHRTLAFVSRAHPESTFAFDYTISVREDTLDKYYGARGFYQAMAQHHGSEALLFSLPEGALGEFLEKRDLQVLRHLDNREIEHAYLTRADGSSIGPMTGHFRLVLAQPQ